MRRAFFHGWVVVAVTAVVVLVTAGVRSAPGAILLTMTGEPGWGAGIVRESVGDYAPAFIAAGGIAILAGFAALGIRRPGSGGAAAAAAAAAAGAM